MVVRLRLVGRNGTSCKSLPVSHLLTYLPTLVLEALRWSYNEKLLSHSSAELTVLI